MPTAEVRSSPPSTGSAGSAEAAWRVRTARCDPSLRTRHALVLGVVSFAFLLAGAPGTIAQERPAGSPPPVMARHGKPKYVITAADTTGLSRAIFAGGCFWCLETAYEGVPGVHAAISGFAGGPENDPTYDEVSSGTTGHTESVLVTFDPSVIPYEELLHIFWTNHDPLTGDRQFCDAGRQYRPAIFPLDEEQERQARASVEWAGKLLKKKGSIVTEITRGAKFWPAEEYHQDFWKKDPVRYFSYRKGCRRDARLRDLWGDLATGH